MRLDFHLHTHCSDGALHPSELLAAVRKSRLEHWAVTDHDTLAGWRALRGEAGLVPGVEVTAEFGGREVHIVGLGIDPEDAAFAAFLAGIRTVRVTRLGRLITTLGESGRLAVTDLGGGTADSLSRYHLAKALVTLGRAPHVSAAFVDLIGDTHCAKLDLPPYPTPAASPSSPVATARSCNPRSCFPAPKVRCGWPAPTSPATACPISSRAPAPVRQACDRELLERVRERMTAEEKLLANDRSAGHDWVEIAMKYGGTPEARRKQYARALDRIAADLGIDEEDPDETRH